MKICGAIFDVDGTLLDSMFIWDIIGENYLRSIGYEPRENLKEVFKNMSLRQAACYYRKEYGVTLGEDEIMEGVNALLERYYRCEFPLKPEMAEFLMRLHKAGVKLCIATATGRYLVEADLSRLGVMSYFSGMFTCYEVGQAEVRTLADFYLEDFCCRVFDPRGSRQGQSSLTLARRPRK